MHRDKSASFFFFGNWNQFFEHLKKTKKTIQIGSPVPLLNYPLVPAAEQISGCFHVEGQPRSSQRSGPLVLGFGPTEGSYRVREPFTSTRLTSAQRTPCLKGLPSGSRHRPVPRRKVANNGDEAHVVYCALSPSKRSRKAAARSSHEVLASRWNK